MCLIRTRRTMIMHLYVWRPHIWWVSSGVWKALSRSSSGTSEVRCIWEDPLLGKPLSVAHLIGRQWCTCGAPRISSHWYLLPVAHAHWWPTSIGDRNSLQGKYYPNLLIPHKGSQRIYVSLNRWVINSAAPGNSLAHNGLSVATVL
jgi:hypothetical protein